MVVTIDHDQQIFLGDQPINIHELPRRLQQSGTDPAHQVIYLRADQTVPFGAFANACQDEHDVLVRKGLPSTTAVPNTAVPNQPCPPSKPVAALPTRLT